MTIVSSLRQLGQQRRNLSETTREEPPTVYHGKSFSGVASARPTVPTSKGL